MSAVEGTAFSPPMSKPGMRAGFMGRLPGWALLALLAYMVVVPLGLLLVASFKPTGLPYDPGFSFEQYRIVYGDPGFYKLVWQTAIFAVGCTVCALFVGGLLAWIVERTDLPMKGAARVMIALPMVLPPFLLAMGWALLASSRTGVLNRMFMEVLGLESAPFNIYSMGGMIFVETLALVPSVYLILCSAFRNMDPSLEEAAMTSGARWPQMIWRIFIPLLSPAILAAAAYLLIVGFLVFDVPGTLGMPVGLFVVSSRIVYLATDQSGGTSAYGQIAAIAVSFLILLLALAWGYRRLTRQANRFITVTGKGFRPRELKLGSLKPLAILFVAVYFALAVVLPLAILIWTSLTPYLAPVSREMLEQLTLSQHRAVFTNSRVGAAAWTSTWVSLLSATLVTGLALLVAWTVLRNRALAERTRGVIDTLAFMPLAIPGTMIGMALVYVYLTLAFLQVYGTAWILVIAYITVYLSFASRAASASLIQVHPELEEAARTCGASTGTTLRRIVLPLLLPGLAGAWVWVVAHVMRELSTALLLQGDGNATVAVQLWSYWSGGEPGKAAAVGVWLVLAMTVITVIWQRLAARREETGK
ncbi:ABC transporter permease [Ottowia sp. VDI28]|uniref:ABC transporter permease n=1 Tax=Ottowia sp. VDI28 TaxID=3133968 RepID=UPI003C2B85A3